MKRQLPAAIAEKPFSLNICWRCFALTGAVALLLFFVLPLAVLASYSFMVDGRNGAIIPTFTLRNYTTLFADWFYLQILGETLFLGVVVATCCAVLAYPVSYQLARSSPRVRGMLVFMVLGPLMVSVVIRNMGWIPILGQSGVINFVLLRLGIIDQPLALINNFVGVVIGLVHALLPLMIMMLTNAFQRVSPQVEEAAINLGSSYIQLFWWVLFPLTRRGLLAGFLLVFTISISSYTTPAIMGGGRVLVMATFIEQQIHQMMRYANGAAIAMVLLVIGVSLTAYSKSRLDRGRV